MGYALHRMDIESNHDDILRVLDLINCGFIARDNAGVILQVNQRLLDWTQRERSELEGHLVDALVPADLVPTLHEELKAVAAGDMRVRLALLQRKDGTTLPVLAIPQLLTDAAGRMVGGVSIIVDLGAVQTAKPMAAGPPNELRGELSQIAMNIQRLAVTAQVRGPADTAMEHPALEELSAREREILGRLVGGDRVPDIAEELHISPHTVRNHLKSIFRKVGVGGQAELIDWVRALR